MNRRNTAVLALLVLGGALIAVLAFRAPPIAGVKDAAARADSRAAPQALPVVAPANPAAYESSPRCDGQQLALTLDGETHALCAGPLSVTQNGSVRVYRVNTTSGPGQWLRIEAAGSTILSAALGAGTGNSTARNFVCKESDCKGISVSRHDVQGVRVISLKNAMLQPAGASGDATASERAVVNGELRTLPEDQVAAFSCPEQGVSIVTSDSSAHLFCPKGGAGFEVSDDGNKTYRFTNLDGDSILVALDEQQHVKQVRYQGDETLACRNVDCGPVSVSEPGAEGQRTFQFGGTTLIETSTGERNAVLSGTLVVPPL